MAEKRTKSIQTRIAERLNDRVGDIAPRVAERMRPVLGNVPVNKDERRRRWWQVEKGWTEEKEMQLLDSGMNRQDVGLLKYPTRELDMKAAGNGDDDRAMAMYAKEMTDLGPPPPEPLEAAAQAIEEGAGATGAAGPAVGATMPAPTMAPPPTPPAMPMPTEGAY